ncbi:MAG: hypothetical protein C5B51_09275 [Terriglobia bacterium]|nr:MAG: hypothetical protein C5B51_09275 [Terriglobia bacterium]
MARVALALAIAVPLWPAKKKKEEETQILQLPRELPAAVVGETRRLAVYVTPLSAKGLLSQQVRDALKALDKQSRGNSTLHIRAFVAGSGDLRRVRDLVSETFTERRLPLPALSLIQAGGLPLEGAQIVLEAVAGAKKDAQPAVAFFSAEAISSPNPRDSLAPLIEKSLAALQHNLAVSGANAGDMLRVTCFLSSLDNAAATRARLQQDYPRAALNFVQTQRAPQSALAACEGVAGLQKSPGKRLELLGANGKPPDGGGSQIALIGAPHVVLTGTQVSFGFQEQDGRLALDRLGKAMEPLGVSRADVAFTHFYPLSAQLENQVRALSRAFFNTGPAPAGSALPVEGLSSQDAGFAVEAVAVKD